MKKYVTILVIFLTMSCFSQTIDLPRNAKPGKCYIKCSIKDFDYDKKIKNSNWEEVPCSSVNKRNKENVNYYKSTRSSNDNAKLIEYKKELIALGYSLESSAKIDKKFIKAHNKYIRKKKREEKKRRINKN